MLAAASLPDHRCDTGYGSRDGTTGRSGNLYLITSLSASFPATHWAAWHVALTPLAERSSLEPSALLLQKEKTKAST